MPKFEKPSRKSGLLGSSLRKWRDTIIASLISELLLLVCLKAANPGCVLGDFVRWYSPRDWVEEETADELGNVTMKGNDDFQMRLLFLARRWCCLHCSFSFKVGRLRFQGS